MNHKNVDQETTEMFILATTNNVKYFTSLHQLKKRIIGFKRISHSIIIKPCRVYNYVLFLMLTTCNYRDRAFKESKYICFNEYKFKTFLVSMLCDLKIETFNFIV